MRVKYFKNDGTVLMRDNILLVGINSNKQVYFQRDNGIGDYVSNSSLTNEQLKEFNTLLTRAGIFGYLDLTVLGLKFE